MSDELLSTKKRLSDLRTGLKRAVREQTVTEIKIKVHDCFGSAVFGTVQFLEDGGDENGIDGVIGLWDRAISLLSGSDVSEEKGDAFKELDKAASMIGCRIFYEGTFPVSQRAVRLVLNVVTEALTNAVRHSRANELYVKMEKSGSLINVEVMNNGEIKPETVREGNGLRALRKKIEIEGGMLSFETGSEFKTIASIPDS